MKVEIDKSRQKLDNKIDVIFIREDGKKANVGLNAGELAELGAKINSYFGCYLLGEYQKKAKSTCTDNSYSYSYLGDGIVEELGEFKGKIAKMVRKGELPVNFTREDVMNLDDKKREALMLELGDMLWFTAVIADWFNWNLDEVAKANVEKLKGRVERNTIVGNGDNR